MDQLAAISTPHRVISATSFFVLVKAAVKMHYDEAFALVVPICSDDEVEWVKRVVLFTKLEVAVVNIAQLCAA